MSTLAVGLANGRKMASGKSGKAVCLGKGEAVGERGASPKVKVKFAPPQPTEVVSTIWLDDGHSN